MMLLEVELPASWPEGVTVAQTCRWQDVPGGAPFDVSGRTEAGRSGRFALLERLAAEGVERIGWLDQVHGTAVVELSGADTGTPRADAAWTARPGVACAVVTADCLPVLLARRDGAVVAAAHAGWRGLAAGIIETTLDALQCASGSEEREQDDAHGDAFVALLGPAIGRSRFEIGPDVRAQLLLGMEADAAARCFDRGRGDRWYADLAGLARLRLQARGVREVHRLPGDTAADEELLYSHRRDGAPGRQATLIWISPRPRSSG